MTIPEVSIIIPNYNCAGFLPKCFQSIRQQALDNYEVIVVDDGSTDDSLEYIHTEQSHWPELKLLQQNKQGPGAARNLAAQYARAPLLAFLDADDWWAEGKLAAQIHFHQQFPDVGLSFTDYEHIEEQQLSAVIRCFDYWPEFGSYLRSQPSGGPFERLANAHALLIAENVIGTSSVVVRRSAFMAVQGFDTSLPSASDWDLWLKLSKIATVGFSRDCLMFYLQRSGSVSSNYSRRFTAVDIILNRYLPDVAVNWPQQAKSAELAREVARHEMYAGNRQYFRAFRCAVTTCWLKPSRHHFKTAVKDLLAATRRH